MGLSYQDEIKEGSFVKKQRPFLLLLCLLMAATGCHHKPVKAVILIPSTGFELPAIHGEENGILEFKLDRATPANSTFVVQFSEPICDPKDKLEGTNTQPVICHIISKSGDFLVTIDEVMGDTGKHRKIPPTGLHLYIRPCKLCRG
jgi:hypothetical protein